MIRDITIGQYLSGTSFMHKLDARVKIVCTFAYIITIFLCKNFWSLGLMVAFAALMTLLSRAVLRCISSRKARTAPSEETSEAQMEISGARIAEETSSPLRNMRCSPASL